MIERLNLYHLLSAFIPGALLLCIVVILFPNVASPAQSTALPGEFSVVALLASSVLAGEVVQTLGSMLEPALFRLFGGRPSDRALAGTLGARYLPTDAAKRIKAKLTRNFGETASARGLFLGAMNLAESAADSKAATFNAQYGHHRAIATLLLATLAVLAASREWGAAATWSRPHYGLAVGILVALVALFVWRTWQRGAYYSREVLLTAERILDRPAAPAAAKPAD